MSWRPPEVTESRLRRRACHYVRQSSEHQVLRNVGSTAVQREGAKILEEWGWERDQIDHIDDLGVRASEPGLRSGFNQVIEGMKSGRYGAISITAHDRLFRNLEELLTFVTVARRYDVLLVHGGQVIDYKDPNSEFISVLLGANATRENRVRSEWLRQSRRKKAEKGIASTTCPLGYVTGGMGTWLKDPDPRLRDVISLVFDKFDELKSAAGVWRYFRRNGIQLRDRRGAWRDPSSTSIVNILRNCAYAGVYQFGKTEADYSRDLSPRGRRHRVRTRPEQRVWLEDHHEHYVSLDRWLSIQRQLTENKHRERPFTGRGDPLLQGLVRCARHNILLHVAYNTRLRRSQPAGSARLGIYRCLGVRDDPERRSCCQANARIVDEVVEAELFRILTPPSIEDIREAARKELQEHEARVRAREAELHQVQQSVAEAERMLGEVDADQPLLRRRLRQRIEEALENRDKVAGSHTRNPLIPSVSFDEAELAELGKLLRDLPALWRHPAVTAQQRKMVVRTVIRAIVVTHRPESWTLEVEWNGSGRTSLEVLTHEGGVAVIRDEYLRGQTAAEIVATLAARGIVQRAGSGAGSPFSIRAVRQWIWRLKLQSRFDVDAYAHIRARYLHGVRCSVIADELNARGIRHRLGKWDTKAVRTAVSLLRRRPVLGVEPLRPVPPYEAAVRELHGAGLWPKEIADRLARSGVQSKYHEPITHGAVLRTLQRLGLRPNSVVAADRTKALLAEWTGTASPGEMARRLNACGHCGAIHGQLARCDTSWRLKGYSRRPKFVSRLC